MKPSSCHITRNIIKKSTNNHSKDSFFSTKIQESTTKLDVPSQLISVPIENESQTQAAAGEPGLEVENNTQPPNTNQTVTLTQNNNQATVCSQASRSLPVSSKGPHSDSDQDTDSRDSTCTSEDDDSNCVKYPTPDQGIFSGSKYENSYKWLYYSVSKAGYCCKICELFSPSQSVCGKSLAFIENIIPTTTACVERIFSLMNSLCTPLRNRLTEGPLNALMRICAEGPVNLTNDNLEQIIDIYKAMKPRKLAL